MLGSWELDFPVPQASVLQGARCAVPAPCHAVSPATSEQDTSVSLNSSKISALWHRLSCLPTPLGGLCREDSTCHTGCWVGSCSDSDPLHAVEARLLNVLLGSGKQKAIKPEWRWADSSASCGVGWRLCSQLRSQLQAVFCFPGCCQQKYRGGPKRVILSPSPENK